MSSKQIFQFELPPGGFFGWLRKVQALVWPPLAGWRYRAVVLSLATVVVGVGLVAAATFTHEPPTKSAPPVTETSGGGFLEDENKDGMPDIVQPPAEQPAAGTPGQAGQPPGQSGGSGNGGGGSSGGGNGNGGSGSGGGNEGGGSVPASWPNASNTGVPAGVALTEYTGPCNINTPGTVIDAKIIDCTINIHAANVTIKRSKVLGAVDVIDGSAIIEDTEHDHGTVREAVIGGSNITVRRANVYGGQASVQCVSNCYIEDSYLHGQYIPPGGDWHLDAFLTNGNGDGGPSNFTLVHNTFACDQQSDGNGSSGCSGDVGLFADFGPVTHVTLDNNLFVASLHLSYCLYGGSTPKNYSSQTSHIVVKNNVFQRGSNGQCGQFGAVSGFDIDAPGNEWTNNKWDDGTVLSQ
jgi:hypothetical protein